MKYRERKNYFYVFTLSLKPLIWKFHVVVWQTASRNSESVENKHLRSCQYFKIISSRNK